MQRYFIHKEHLIDDVTCTVTKEDAHHIIHVMRMNQGDQVLLVDHKQRTYLSEIKTIENKEVFLSILKEINEDKELPVAITIAQGLPKGSKLEYIVQKSTELGASSFLLLQMDRSVAKWDDKSTKKKLPRYEKIIKEACEQSHRTLLPTIDGIWSVKQLTEQFSHYDHVLFAYEEEAKSPSFASLYQAVKNIQRNEKILVIIGPEGGFSDKEVNLLQQHEAQAVRLGKRILRTETAPLYVLSAISFYLEEMN